MNDRDIWQTVHQPFELRYHQHVNFRWPNQEKLWREQWDAVFGFAELTPDSFSPQTAILDVGCGSKPAVDWFHQGQKYFIDPLLDEYLKIQVLSQYWTSHSLKHMMAQPAEEMVSDWTNRFDFLLCWNVLDHSFDPLAIVDNLFLYAKLGATILLGTDVSAKAHIGHPGIGLSTELIAKINSRFKVKKTSCRAQMKFSRDLTLLLEK